MASDKKTVILTTEARREKIRSVPFWIKFFGSGFFSGFFPIAPGTAGSAVALAIYWFIPGFESWYILGSVALLFLPLGIFTAQKIEEALGADPSVVVIDEFVGMWIALLAIPKGLILALCAFIAFRVFDIIKPPPARQFDQMSGGIGIMMDDVVAGIYANLAIRIILYIPAQF